MAWFSVIHHNSLLDSDLLPDQQSAIVVRLALRLVLLVYLLLEFAEHVSSILVCLLLFLVTRLGLIVPVGRVSLIRFNDLLANVVLLRV